MFPSWLQSVWKTVQETRPFPRLRRREIAILVGVAAVSALVTLAVMLPSAARRHAHQADRTEAQAKKTERLAETPAESAGFSLSLSDFLLPEQQMKQQEPAFYPFRGRMTRWSSAQVERYWVPPREVAAGVLARSNDAAMEKFFEEVK